MVHRIAFVTVVLAVALGHATPSSAQTYSARKARRQFVTISYDWLNTEPYKFAEHPLADLVGREVVPAQFESYDYKTADGQILIRVPEFRKRLHGAGVTVYPFGASAGAALGIRGSREELPTIRIDFSGPGAPAHYELTGARAYDVSAGLYMMDHSTGWGLGSHAFIAGGVGRIKAGTREGSRYFAEGGGGMNSGPIGVELSIKFAVNRLDDPVPHRFVTIPIALRATVSF